MNSEIKYYQYKSHKRAGSPSQIISVQYMHHGIVKVGYYWFNVTGTTPKWSYVTASLPKLNLENFKEITKEECDKEMFLHEL